MTKIPNHQAVMLRAVICDDCNTAGSGPWTLCPACRGRNISNIETPGEGTLLSWTVIRKPPLEYRDQGAYVVALVKLESGIQVLGRLSEEPEDSQLGVAVRAISAPGTKTATFERIPS